MHNQERAYEYADLILRYLKGELNEAETKTLYEWRDSDIRNSEFLESLNDKESLQTQFDFFSSIDKISAWNNISSNRSSKRIYKLSSILKYAAAVLLIVSVSAFYYITYSQKEQQFVAKKPNKLKQDIAPGGDKLKLTLSNGTVIALEDIENGTISSVAGVKISKQNGQLVYQIVDAGSSGKEILYNTISTPRGGQYQILLPDGSKVWLNASSSLNYPTSFSGKERVVKLSGEAYFEVSKNKAMPFRVVANDAEIKVLGTHFNVKAYPEESEINTTLLEGSVKVNKGNNSQIIVPGQQAITNHSAATIKVSEADVDEVVAWKNGVFLFNNEDISMVMQQIARWYDIEIEYKGKMPVAHFTGKISRNNNISKILNLLELTGGVRFTIEDKKIIVYK